MGKYDTHRTIIASPLMAIFIMTLHGAVGPLPTASERDEGSIIVDNHAAVHDKRNSYYHSGHGHTHVKSLTRSAENIEQEVAKDAQQVWPKLQEKLADSTNAWATAKASDVNSSADLPSLHASLASSVAQTSPTQQRKVAVQSRNVQEDARDLKKMQVVDSKSLEGFQEGSSTSRGSSVQASTHDQSGNERAALEHRSEAVGAVAQGLVNSVGGNLHNADSAEVAKETNVSNKEVRKLDAGMHLEPMAGQIEARMEARMKARTDTIAAGKDHNDLKKHSNTATKKGKKSLDNIAESLLEMSKKLKKAAGDEPDSEAASDEPDSKAIFDKIDEDKNGKIEKDEFERALENAENAEAFDKITADKEEKSITEEEFSAAMTEGTVKADWFKKEGSVEVESKEAESGAESRPVTIAVLGAAVIVGLFQSQ